MMRIMRLAFVLVFLALSLTVAACRPRSSQPEARIASAVPALANQQGNNQSAHLLTEQIIAPRQQPIRFKLVRDWQANAIAQPGNVVCTLDQPRTQLAQPVVRIHVLDGSRTVIVLNTTGARVGRHALKIPPDAAIEFLRTTVDPQGQRWWLGGAKGERRLFLFNADWDLHTTVVPLESAALSTILAVQLLDGNGDEAPTIIVAYAAAGGVRGLNGDGQLLWENLSLQAVRGLVLAAPQADGKRGILCADGQGRLLSVSPAGEVETVAIGLRDMQSLFSGPVAANGAWTLLGLTGNARGRNAALGIDPGGEWLWDIDLPNGMHRSRSIEPVAWADLLGTPRWQWLIAGPDGSVTVAWGDGRVVDCYHHGSDLTGIGGYHSDGGHIVVATRESVESFRLDDIALD